MRAIGKLRGLLPLTLALFLLAVLVGASAWAGGRASSPAGSAVAGAGSAGSGGGQAAAVPGGAFGDLSGALIRTAETEPKITKQPVNTTAVAGALASASFEATASGKPAPTVQWEVSTDGGTMWSAIPGATSTFLLITPILASEDGHEFRAVFKSKAGEVISNPATLTVHSRPAVTQQPASVSVKEGLSAVFEATASGSPAPTVQWEVSTNNGAQWTPIAGATSSQLTIAATKAADNGHWFRAVFTNLVGTTPSAPAILTVLKAPAVTKDPSNTEVNEGEDAVFEAASSGSPPPTVQWEVSADGGGSWSPLEGATSTKLTLTGVVFAQSGNEYRAVFANRVGEATTKPATLTVNVSPLVTEAPVPTTVAVGETAVFSAAASGVPPPTVKWQVSADGGVIWSDLEGATSDELAITNAQLTQSGNEYRAVFVNKAGEATSAPATLTVATSKFDAVGWGLNDFGQLGDGTLESSPAPTPVGGLHFVMAVAAGRQFSLALLADGRVMAWGRNASGQLGDGSQVTSEVPVEVQGLPEKVKAIAAGANFALALLKNGTVMAWGSDGEGQLGDGAGGEEHLSEVPVPVKGLKGVKAISAGGEHSLAVLENGTVWAWGEDDEGELGNGGAVKEKGVDVPAQIKSLSAITSVAAGGNFDLALPSNGTVKAWGGDENGQLGRPAPEPECECSTAPAAVPGLSGVTSVAAGATHALALLGGGTVMAWGSDGEGQLGDGTMKPLSEAPLPVSGLSGVTAISAGNKDSAALLGSGAAMTWGANGHGQLGDGLTGGASDVPVAVVGITKVASISAGGLQSSHMLAFGEPLPAVASISPQAGQTAGGTEVQITGANLTGATAIRFGANAATTFEVTSATTAKATAPAGTGTVDVTVTTPSGTSPAVPADRFTYQPAPTVTKLSVKGGPAAGGTSVTITGTEFVNVASVSFAGNPSPQFKVNSPTSITAESPPGIAGTVSVTVSTAGGQSAPSRKGRFTYSPAVEGVAPNSGPAAGGTPVTVTGAGFLPGAGVDTFKFGTKKATAVVCSSATTCTMTSPVGAVGTVNVTVQIGKAKSPANPPGDSFTYT